MSVNKSALSPQKYSWLSSPYLPDLEMQSATKVMQNVSFLDVSTVKPISNLIVALGNSFLRSKESFFGQTAKEWAREAAFVRGARIWQESSQRDSLWTPRKWLFGWSLCSGCTKNQQATGVKTPTTPTNTHRPVKWTQVFDNQKYFYTYFFQAFMPCFCVATIQFV